MRKRFGTNDWRVLRLASGAQRGKAGEREGEREREEDGAAQQVPALGAENRSQFQFPPIRPSSCPSTRCRLTGESVVPC